MIILFIIYGSINITSRLISQWVDLNFYFWLLFEWLSSFSSWPTVLSFSFSFPVKIIFQVNNLSHRKPYVYFFLGNKLQIILKDRRPKTRQKKLFDFYCHLFIIKSNCILQTLQVRFCKKNESYFGINLMIRISMEVHLAVYFVLVPEARLQIQAKNTI